MRRMRDDSETRSAFRAGLVSTAVLTAALATPAPTARSWAAPACSADDGRGAKPPACLGLGAAGPERNEGKKMKEASKPRNVLGGELAECGRDPLTGFYRTGYCETGPGDSGVHVVCAEVTEEFLSFTKSKGNDLSTPAPQFGFPGLKPGDRWCLCASRWAEAERAGKAPKVVLEATHAKAVEIVPLEALLRHEAGSGARR